MSDERDVLIVDSDFALIKLFELAGKQFNVNTFSAKDGVDAQAKCKLSTFRLIVSEINIARLDGIKLVDKIRENIPFKNIPIILVSKNLSKYEEDLKKLTKVTALERPINLQTIKKLYSVIFK